MVDYTRTDLPADITVFHGSFASQPLVFAHLLDAAPSLDLTHVEVIQSNHATRLAARFGPHDVADLAALGHTLVLILPGAYSGLACPLSPTEHLTHIGTFRGTIPHLRVAQ